MKESTFPEEPHASSPAGAHIRYLIESELGGMIHSTVPAGQINRAMVHKTVSEFWHVLEGHGQIWRDDGNDERVVDLLPGVTIDIPVGTKFQYRNVGTEDLKFICVTMPPWIGDEEATPVEGHMGVHPCLGLSLPRQVIVTARALRRGAANDTALFFDPTLPAWACQYRARRSEKLC